MNAHWKYLKYLLRHKWFVAIACWRLGIWYAAVQHDWSKFLPSEWRPYVGFFYSRGAQTPQARQRFDRAWNHHQKRNPHHWQYWLLTMDSGDTTALPMPDRYRREMLADWIGAGRAITGHDNTVSWYLKNADQMRLHAETRRWVEQQLAIPYTEHVHAV